MKSFYINDKRNRQLYIKFEKKKKLLKFFFNNFFINKNKRYKAFLTFSKLPKKTSLVKINNRCIITNRNRGISRKFRLSRIELKRLILKGVLPGVKLAKW